MAKKTYRQVRITLTAPELSCPRIIGPANSTQRQAQMTAQRLGRNWVPYMAAVVQRTPTVKLLLKLKIGVAEPKQHTYTSSM